MYLTRNQAGVYSPSGVRIPPSPPDFQRPFMGRSFFQIQFFSQIVLFRGLIAFHQRNLPFAF